jgi:F-type H+-transporting ATPase subunit delta
VKSSSVGRRYARALIDLAEANKQTERVAKDLTDFADSFAKSKDLRDIFENPQITKESRKKVLGTLLDRMAVAPVVKSALLLLSDRGRLRYIGEIAEAFQTISESRAGRVRAEVTTAVAMPEAYFTEITKVLEGATGKKVVLIKKQDPSIIAGVVTRVGDKIFDGSVRTRLGELKERMLAD